MVARSKLLTLSRCTVDLIRTLDAGVPVASLRNVVASAASVELAGKSSSAKPPDSAALTAGAALAAAVMAAGATTAMASCDSETPLHRLQLDALKQWLKDGGSEVSGITFESAEVREHALLS